MPQPNSVLNYRISDVSRALGLSADTLRYYEKIGLLPPINRSASGIRLYRESDLSQLRFIQRAKSMKFSLDEVAQLLEMRQDPQNVRKDVRELSHRKLQQVERHLKELGTLHRELSALIGLCQGTDDGCPIINDLEKHAVLEDPR